VSYSTWLATRGARLFRSATIDLKEQHPLISVLNSNCIRDIKVKLQLKLLSPDDNLLIEFSKSLANEIF